MTSILFNVHLNIQIGAKDIAMSKHQRQSAELWDHHEKFSYNY